MGKKLIIKDADFSANGFTYIYDLTNTIANSIYWHALARITGLADVNHTYDVARCCISALAFEDLGIDITPFTKLHIKLKTPYNYVLTTGTTAPGSSSGWQSWDGTTGGGSFAWATNSPHEATATINSSTVGMAMNFRRTDGLNFWDGVTLLDIVEYIRLEP